MFFNCFRLLKRRQKRREIRILFSTKYVILQGNCFTANSLTNMFRARCECIEF